LQQDLTHLDFSNSQLTPLHGVVLSYALRKNHTLTSLNLSHNHIAESGRTFASVLLSNKTLTKLDLTDTGLAREVGTYFAQTLRTNNRITHLELAGNGSIASETLLIIKHLICRNRQENFYSSNLEEILKAAEKGESSALIALGRHFKYEALNDSGERFELPAQPYHIEQTRLELLEKYKKTGSVPDWLNHPSPASVVTPSTSIGTNPDADLDLEKFLDKLSLES